VPAGVFLQGSPDSDADALSDEKPERAVTVSSYALDKFEVTVGRFRKFVQGWDYKPLPGGAGAHPRIAGSGWNSAWNRRLPANSATLESSLSCAKTATWTPDALKESLPINCVSWYEAFAFCAWDGGRLPTEAEWEYAAAGGDMNRKYPWGSTAPTNTLAVYDCGYGGTPNICYASDIAPVGSTPLGAGRWQHEDLAGSMYEWALDAYDEYPGVGSKDYADTQDAPIRTIRGGSWGNVAGLLRSAFRLFTTSSYRYNYYGFRCAREP
jgi:formylglycine-generating enzyme required for sulfatase activity